MNSLRKRYIKEVTYRPDERWRIFSDLSVDDKVYVYKRLSRYVQRQLVAKLKDETLLELIERIDPDESTDLIQLLNPKRRKEILLKVGSEMQKELSVLLEFDPKTAAGLMSLNYVQVEKNEKLSEVALQVKKHEQRTGKHPLVLVIDEGKLLGFLPLRRLMFVKPNEKVLMYVKRVTTIKHSARPREVVTHFLENPHQKVVVLSETDNVLGVLYSDDVLRVMNEKESSTLYDFAGVREEEAVTDSIREKVKRRYIWLLINLATAFFASFTVGLFDETIRRNVLLAVYMPIVAGMGGNAATQTLAVMVRGITLGEIQLSNVGKALRREVGAGFFNGFLNGFIVFLIVTLTRGDWLVGFVLGVALVVNMMVAAFFGTLVPLLIKRMGKDPATSATIFITTATDVLGFSAFLGLASLLLK